jgi:hypothetical protein
MRRKRRALDRQPVDRKRLRGVSLLRDDLDQLLRAVEDVIVAHDRIDRGTEAGDPDE